MIDLDKPCLLSSDPRRRHSCFSNNIYVEKRFTVFLFVLRRTVLIKKHFILVYTYKAEYGVVRQAFRKKFIMFRIQKKLSKEQLLWTNLSFEHLRLLLSCGTFMCVWAAGTHEHWMFAYMGQVTICKDNDKERVGSQGFPEEWGFICATSTLVPFRHACLTVLSEHCHRSRAFDPQPTDLFGNTYYHNKLNQIPNFMWY